MPVTHTLFPLFLSPSTIREMLKISRGMAQHPQLPLPNDPNKDIWSYHELHQINSIVFDDHLVIVFTGTFSW